MIGESFGNYRVLAKLGEGGMGAVYLAEHPNIGRKVAVKVLRPEYSNNAEALRRFIREARSTATLRHPALVDVIDYDVHEKTGQAFIIMEYLEGESLQERLDREHKLLPANAAEIARQVALGMDAAHRAGIIHRDLKPGNVFVVPDPMHPGREIAKVLDFGIAKLATGDKSSGLTTQANVLLGTPRYMAPEQCRGAGQVDARADVYSLGCMLYEMLCGQPPFIYTWSGELIAAHLGETPPPPTASVATLADPLDTLVMRMLAKDVNERPANMKEVAEALEPFASAIDMSFPPTSIVARPSSSAPDAAGPPPASDAVRPSSDDALAGKTASVILPAGLEPFGTPAVSNALAAPKRGAWTDTADTTGRGVAEALLRTGTARLPLGRRAWAIAAALAFGTATFWIVLSQRGARPAIAPSQSAAEPALALSSMTDLTAEPTAAPSQVAEPTAAPSSQIAELSGRPSQIAAEPAATPSQTATDPVGPPQTGAHHANTPGPHAAAAQRTATSGAAASARAVVRIAIGNPKPGLQVTVDGRSASLPLTLPRDQAPHIVVFTSPKFRPETKQIIADHDKTIVLENRPLLFVPR